MHGQCLKRIGCDCLTLIRAVYGVLEEIPALPAYRPDEWMHSSEERYAEGLAQYFVPLGPVIPHPADLVAFRFGRRQVAHCGVATGPETFIAANMENGRVEESVLKHRFWSRRYSGAWRLKRWVP